MMRLFFKYYFGYGITYLSLSLSLFSLYAQTSPPSTSDEELNLDLNIQDKSKSITLQGTIEQGLRLNPDERARQYQNLILELQSESIHAGFWYPHIQMSLNTDNQRISKLRSRDNQSDSSKSGYGYFGLEFNEYVLFNWGKDHLVYLNQKGLNERGKERIFEQRRMLKQTLIDLYFRLNLMKEIERIYLDQVKHATFIYRLNREKAPLRKITQQEFLESRALYLSLQKEYNQARIEAHTLDKEMAFMIGDPISSFYYAEENLNFKKLTFPLENSLQLYAETNPSIRDQKIKYQNAVRDIEKTFKDNLPLPKFSLNLGSYVHSFSTNEGNTSFNTDKNGPGGENLEVRGSINLSWDLVGEKGLFNTRERSTVYYQKLIAEIELERAQTQSERMIRDLYRRVHELERQYLILQPALTNAQKRFDHALENYLQKQTNFLNLKDALHDLKKTQIELNTVKYQHLAYKLELAKLIGIEDFPGDNFEQVAMRGPQREETRK